MKSGYTVAKSAPILLTRRPAGALSHGNDSPAKAWQVTHAFCARIRFTRAPCHSHNAQHSRPRPTGHRYSKQSGASTLSSTTCTAGCHLVACADTSASEVVADVDRPKQLSPASSGHSRRAWSKRIEEPALACASPFFAARFCTFSERAARAQR